MNKREMYNELCTNTRRDPNAALLVNGHRYDVLIDTIGLDSCYDTPTNIEVRCKIRNVPYFCRTYASNIPTVNNAKIEKVIFHDPATIVFWSDNTKTVVKCQDGDRFDPEKGLAIAITKKAFGNQGNYCNEFKKHIPDAFITTVTAKDVLKGGIYAAALAEAKRENRQLAYNRLLKILSNSKATKLDLLEAIKDATNYLEHAIED